MLPKAINIAILSPSKDAYSETFIQAHKNFLKGRVYFFNSGILPTKLEGGNLINSRRLRILNIIRGHFNLNRFSLPEIALINSFKKNKIDIVLAEYGDTAQKALKICKHLKLPLIVHFHGYDASVSEVIKNNYNYKEVFETASFVVVVSKKMYRDFSKLGCPEQKLIYNVYGPNDEFLTVQPNFSKQQFIAIGRFVDKKAPYYLILSFLKVIEKFPEAKLIMAGDGQLLDTCKNLVRYFKLEANINFVGVISPKKYREYLEESLAFVQHSVTAENGDSEGTPVGILEANGAGLPVISTRHAGIPDVIIHGKTGLLVEEHDVDGMAENMIKLLENPEIAKEMGAKGKINIEGNFTLKRHVELLDTLIERAVKPSLRTLKS
jgi:glycosyltransferase involved in cell wall biosynthesis